MEFKHFHQESTSDLKSSFQFDSKSIKHNVAEAKSSSSNVAKTTSTNNKFDQGLENDQQDSETSKGEMHGQIKNHVETKDIDQRNHKEVIRSRYRATSATTENFEINEDFQSVVTDGSSSDDSSKSGCIADAMDNVNNEESFSNVGNKSKEMVKNCGHLIPCISTFPNLNMHTCKTQFTWRGLFPKHH